MHRSLERHYSYFFTAISLTLPKESVMEIEDHLVSKTNEAVMRLIMVQPRANQSAIDERNKEKSLLRLNITVLSTSNS